MFKRGSRALGHGTRRDSSIQQYEPRLEKRQNVGGRGYGSTAARGRRGPGDERRPRRRPGARGPGARRVDDALRAGPGGDGARPRA